MHSWVPCWRSPLQSQQKLKETSVWKCILPHSYKQVYKQTAQDWFSSIMCFGSRRIWENRDDNRWQVCHDTSNRAEMFPGCDFSLYSLLSTQHVGEEINVFSQVMPFVQAEFWCGKPLQLFSLDFVPLVDLRLFKKSIKHRVMSCTTSLIITLSKSPL